MKHKLLTLLLALTLLVSNPTISGTVLSVGDGDTIKVVNSTGTTTVRLACIDAPERGQRPYWSNARNRLKELLPLGKEVDLLTSNTDRYGRTIAEVISEGKSVNLQMVSEGEAVVYRDYIKPCSKDKEAYLLSEQQAKELKLGYWQQDNPVMPWEFRKIKK